MIQILSNPDRHNNVSVFLAVPLAVSLLPKSTGLQLWGVQRVVTVSLSLLLLVEQLSLFYLHLL